MDRKILLIMLLFIPTFIFADTKSKDATINEIVGPTINELEIYWDEMKFTYKNELNYSYNELEHKYDLIKKGNWISDENTVKIINKSTMPVDVKLECSIRTTNGNIGYTFSKNNFTINSNKEEEVIFNLEGELDDSISSMKKIGNIKIVIE